MKKDIILLKQRINKNYKEIQRKYPLSKIVLKKIDEFIENNTSSQTVDKWLSEHDNIIFSLEYTLKNLEK